MKVVERCTQRVKPGKFNEFIALEKKFDAAEAKLGNVPPKRRYWAAHSGLYNDTNIWEREWDSMADIEAYNKKTMDNPEWEPLFKEAGEVFFDGRFELFYLWDNFPEN